MYQCSFLHTYFHFFTHTFILFLKLLVTLPKDRLPMVAKASVIRRLIFFWRLWRLHVINNVFTCQKNLWESNQEIVLDTVSVHWVPIQRSEYRSLRSAATTPLIMGWSTILPRMHVVSNASGRLSTSSFTSFCSRVYIALCF